MSISSSKSLKRLQFSYSHPTRNRSWPVVLHFSGSLPTAVSYNDLPLTRNIVLDRFEGIREKLLAVVVELDLQY